MVTNLTSIIIRRPQKQYRKLQGCKNLNPFKAQFSQAIKITNEHNL